MPSLPRSTLLDRIKTLSEELDLPERDLSGKKDYELEYILTMLERDGARNREREEGVTEKLGGLVDTPWRNKHREEAGLEPMTPTKKREDKKAWIEKEEREKSALAAAGYGTEIPEAPIEENPQAKASGEIEEFLHHGAKERKLQEKWKTNLALFCETEEDAKTLAGVLSAYAIRENLKWKFGAAPYNGGGVISFYWEGSPNPEARPLPKLETFYSWSPFQLVSKPRHDAERVSSTGQFHSKNRALTREILLADTYKTGNSVPEHPELGACRLPRRDRAIRGSICPVSGRWLITSPEWRGSRDARRIILNTTSLTGLKRLCSTEQCCNPNHYSYSDSTIPIPKRRAANVNKLDTISNLLAEVLTTGEKKVARFESKNEAMKLLNLLKAHKRVRPSEWEELEYQTRGIFKEEDTGCKITIQLRSEAEGLDLNFVSEEDSNHD